MYFNVNHSLDFHPSYSLQYFQVIACLDVQSNDNGDLVVTKGDQYDVRDHTSSKDVQSFIH